MDETVAHAEVFFSGHVQGVGFRYSTYQVAQGFEVCGAVRNLPDGRVALEAEGEEDELRAFVAEVERQLASFIRQTEARWGQRAARYQDFTIAR